MNTHKMHICTISKCPDTVWVSSPAYSVTTEHHRVEIQADLADLRHSLGDLVGACPGGGVGRGEVGVLDVGDIFRDRCPALIRLVDAAN